MNRGTLPAGIKRTAHSAYLPQAFSHTPIIRKTSRHDLRNRSDPCSSGSKNSRQRVHCELHTRAEVGWLKMGVVIASDLVKAKFLADQFQDAQSFSTMN